jgi:hypothetical protein
MKSDFVPTDGQPTEWFVLQIDGEITSEHRLFLDALRAGLQLNQMFPQSDVKVRERRMLLH